MDLFKKCYDFTRADDIKAKGIYPYFRAIQENEGPVVMIEGMKKIMAGSNNYLGLTAHPKVKEAAINAIKKYGTGCSGSRYLTGTIDLHIELEQRLAKFMGKEAVLLFSTGYQTAQGVIPTIVARGEYVISDRDNHASIVAGNLLATSTRTEVLRYKHNDMKDLEKVLSKLPAEAGKLIVSDGVFSAGGEICNLPEIVKLARAHNAKVLMDDAHAVGVIGVDGKGTASEFGLVDEVDMTIGTFSKTFASLGGFVASEAKVIDYLKHHASALIFSASPTPASVAAALAALDILEANPDMPARVVNNAKIVRDALKDAGFEVTGDRTAIVPVLIGDDDLSFKLWKNLYDFGVFTNVFISPGVPQGKQSIRTSFMATHEKKHLDVVIDGFIKCGKELGIIK